MRGIMPYRRSILPRIEVRGAPFEIGLQYGQKARPRIRRHFANQHSLMAARSPVDPDWWRRAVHKQLASYEEFAPYFVDEMHGLARGADLAFEEILLLNVRDELTPAPRAAPADACTSFGCHGALTLSGGPILGQTKDTAAISPDLYVVLAMRQQGRPDLLQMPYAGELGVFGLSSTGMSAFGNSIYVRGRATGRLPWSLFRRLVLEAGSVDEVLALVHRHGVQTAGNLTIGDASGRAVAIEVTDHGAGIVEAEDGILVHANHICSPGLVCCEDYTEPERSASHARQARLRELLAAERGRLTAPLAVAALTDHANYPRSICRHASGLTDIRTTAALVVEPAAGLVHIVRGQVCQGWPATYSL